VPEWRGGEGEGELLAAAFPCLIGQQQNEAALWSAWVPVMEGDSLKSCSNNTGRRKGESRACESTSFGLLVAAAVAAGVQIRER
jgi:hypothetical protein